MYLLIIRFFLSFIMPKTKKKNLNNKMSSRSDSGSSKDESINIPPVEYLLTINNVMDQITKEKDLNNKLVAGQWILKPKCKGHNVYYRYVILEGGNISKQSVTHSCTSGRKADVHRCHDLTRRQYTSDGGVIFVVNSTYVLQNTNTFHP